MKKKYVLILGAVFLLTVVGWQGWFYQFATQHSGALTDTKELIITPDNLSAKKALQVADNNSSSLGDSLSTRESRPALPVLDLNAPKEGLSGELAIKALGNHLADVAAHYGKTTSELADTLRQDPTMRVNSKGRIFFVDLKKDQHTKDAGDQKSAQTSSGGDASVAAQSVANQPLADTFLLHSLPGATKIIYLDFDGFTLSGTQWNDDYNSGNNIVAPPWDIDGDPNTFSDAEKTMIQDVWRIVADAYAPFNIDVTTEYPGEAALTRSDVSDTHYGTRVLVSPTIDSYFCSCGGIAYIDVFGDVGDYNKTALVFNGVPGDTALDIGTTASHEAGHNLGLIHDGKSGPGGGAYYDGQGNWAPIMGSGYGRSIHQWSKGEYSNANNTEDDVAIIAANTGVGYRADDYGSSRLAATALVGLPSDAGGIKASGIVAHASESDFSSFQVTTTGTVQILVDSLSGSTLHAGVSVYDGTDTLLASSEAADSSNGISAVTISRTFTPGTYYVAVTGKGVGSATTTGYTAYGSLGFYNLTISATTSTPLPTSTPTRTPTNTPSPTATHTPTNVPTLAPTSTPTFTPTITPVSVEGNLSKSGFGSSVAYLGDINNDGVGDYVVGAYLYDANGLSDSGQAKVISGQTGFPLFTFDGDAAKDYFGFAVANAGDVNDDHVNDIAVGAYLADDNTNPSVVVKDAGTVKVFSGVNGNLLYQRWGATSKEYFGYAVAGGEDVDGDGNSDVVVGAPQADHVSLDNSITKDVGAVYVFLGSTGTLYRTYYGDVAKENLGKSAAVLDDLDNDNLSEIIAGAPLSDNNGLKDSGYARIYSPAADYIVQTLSGAASGDNFGFSVANAGDVNDDGMDDIIIGAYKRDVFTTKNQGDAGTVSIYSGADRMLIREIQGSTSKDYFGYSVAGAGDLNSDGYDDVLVGSPLFDAPIVNSTKKLKDAGKVFAYSGIDGSQLIGVNGVSPGDNLGWSISGGEVTGDNVEDIITGALKDDVTINTTSIKDAGAVYLISGAAMLP